MEFQEKSTTLNVTAIICNSKYGKIVFHCLIWCFIFIFSGTLKSSSAYSMCDTYDLSKRAGWYPLLSMTSVDSATKVVIEKNYFRHRKNIQETFSILKN